MDQRASTQNQKRDTARLESGGDLRSRSRTFFEYRDRTRCRSQRDDKAKSDSLNARVFGGVAVNRHQASAASRELRGFVSVVKIGVDYYPFSYTSNVCPKTGRVVYLYYATLENGNSAAIDKIKNTWQFLPERSLI